MVVRIINMALDILYHYCSNESFYLIVSSKSIHMSSLSLSNDKKEGKLVTEVFMSIVNENDNNNIYKRQLKDKLLALEQIVDGVGFCLSEEGDLLSQWRGYADDASGVSIGFSRKNLNLIVEKFRFK